MKLAEIKVKYWLEDRWGEDEVYEIFQEKSDPDNGKIKINSPMAQAMIDKKPGDVVSVLDGKYLIVDIVSEAVLMDLISGGEHLFNNADYTGLIAAGWKLTNILLNSIKFPQNTDKFLSFVVSAHLSEKDAMEALRWIKVVEKNGIKVEAIKEQLENIVEIQEGRTIEDISDPIILNLLAELHKRLVCFKKAFLLYERSLQIDNSSIYTYNGIGGLCRAAKRFDDGIKYYTKSLDLKLNKFALNGLGGIYRDTKEFVLAEKVYSKSIAIDSKDCVYARNGLGAIYFDQGFYNQGEEQFMLGGDEKYLLKLFFEYKSEDTLEKALRCLESLLVKNPHNTVAKNLYQRYATLPCKDDIRD